MCSLQQLQKNIVFGAKRRANCGSMQKSHQHVMLCAISSKSSDTCDNPMYNDAHAYGDATWISTG
jgi:hypothetical protein